MKKAEDVLDMMEEDGPVEKMVFTKSGRAIDLQNVPGKVKLELIEANQLQIDAFIAPANMPGKKLKLLRDQHRERVMAAMRARQVTTGKPIPEHLTPKPVPSIKAGATIVYKKRNYEVIELRGDKVLISKEGRKTLVPIDLVALKKG